MARQEEGWPLGLQLLNVRVGLGGRARDYVGSISFNTLLTSSSTSSTDSSSDLDTESTGSFLHDRSMTLGSLIGAASIFDLSRRSMRGRRRAADHQTLQAKKPFKSRAWFFSLCSKDSTDVRSPENPPPSLRQFLAVQRRSSTTATTNSNSGNLYGITRDPDGNLLPDEMSLAQHLASVSNNSLFLNREIAPPRLHSGSRSAEEVERNYIRELDDH